MLQTLLHWIERENRSLVIGISGHDAAGKTTFTKQLAEQLSGEVEVLNTDTYIMSANIRNYTIVPFTYDGASYTSKMTACHPGAHYVAALERDIAMRKSDETKTKINPYYAQHDLPQERRITIVEGMTVAFANAELFDVRLYFYTDRETAFERRASSGENGDELKASYDNDRMQYELFMHPYSEQFDVVMKSTIDQPWIVEKNMLV